MNHDIDENIDPIEDAQQGLSDVKDIYDTAKDVKDLFDRNGQHAQTANIANKAGQDAAKNMGQDAAKGATGATASSVPSNDAHNPTQNSRQNPLDAQPQHGVGNANHPNKSHAPSGAQSQIGNSSATNAAGMAGSTATQSAAGSAGATASGAGATAAGGIAGGPLGAALMALISAKADALKERQRKAAKATAGMLIALIWLIFTGTLIGYHSSAEIRTYAESEFDNSVMDDEWRADESYRFTKNETRDVIGTDYDFNHINEKAMREFIKATDEEIEAAFKLQLAGWAQYFDKCILYKIKNKILAILGIEVEEDTKKSLEHFYKATYPYAKAYQQNKFYTIGDYLYSVGYPGDSENVFQKSKNEGKFKLIPEDERYNDVNHEEIFAIITQGSQYDVKHCTIQDYRKIFSQNEDTQEHLYEIKLDQIYYTHIPHTETDETTGETKTWYEYFESKDVENSNFKTYGMEAYYFKPTIYPYGLVEMYELANGLEHKAENFPKAVEEMEKPFQYSEYQDNETHLDWIEKLDRLYCRLDLDNNKTIDETENYIGPAYDEDREQGWSFIYGKGSPESVKTGRSARYYIHPDEQEYLKDYPDHYKYVIDDDAWEEAENNITIDPSLIDGIEDETLKQIIMEALAQVGKPYVWGATGPNSFDCSGLVQHSFRMFGINLPRTSREQFNATTPIAESDAKPGDLVFWYKRGTSTIGHVGIYLGNGKFVEAKGAKWGIVVSPLRRDRFAGFHRISS